MALISRRSLLTGAAALAAQAAQAAPPQLRLRLLETSDLHMFATDFDYYRDRAEPTVGLAKVARLIRTARAEHPNVMLFDNGDIIQGNPLGDWVAQPGNLPPGAVHPMFQAMNLLGYDAATLGNHEFNYGLPFLDRSLAGAAFPFVCANLEHLDGRSYLPPSMVIERDVKAEDGAMVRLKIGVIGFLPPQIMVWDRSNLEGRVRAVDIVAAAERYVPALRARCDVLVALCHSGIESGPRTTGFENAAYHLAEVPGFDVIFTGHSHRVFPGPDYQGRPGVDAVRGTLAGVPAVMPGFWGSHLGIIDLDLVREGARWAVANFRTEARPIYRREGARVISLAEPDPAIAGAVGPAHAATQAWVRRPVGDVEFPVHSYFALLGSEASVGLVNAGQAWYARRLLADTLYAGLPLLAAAAPFKAGGTGPDSFVDIAPGALALRDVADLYQFANTLVAVKITGAQVAAWLERSTGVFQQILPGQDQPQDLLVRSFPTYNFDVISGLTCQIDLTQPYAFDGKGDLVRPEARRIVDLRFAGRPIDGAQEFIVVTNNYRSDGGGRFPGLDGSKTVLRAPDLNRDAIVSYLQAQGRLADLPAPTWSFLAPSRPVVLSVRLAAAAERFLPGRPDLRRVAGSEDGYAKFEMRLA